MHRLQLITLSAPGGNQLQPGGRQHHEAPVPAPSAMPAPRLLLLLLPRPFEGARAAHASCNPSARRWHLLLLSAVALAGGLAGAAGQPSSPTTSFLFDRAERPLTVPMDFHVGLLGFDGLRDGAVVEVCSGSPQRHRAGRRPARPALPHTPPGRVGALSGVLD